MSDPYGYGNYFDGDAAAAYSAQVNARASAGVNPDEAARADALARRMDAPLPQAAIIGNVPAIESQVDQAADDAAIARSPHVAKWAADPNNARVAAPGELHGLADFANRAAQIFAAPGPGAGVDIGNLLDLFTGSRPGTANAAIGGTAQKGIADAISGIARGAQMLAQQPGFAEAAQALQSGGIGGIDATAPSIAPLVIPQRSAPQTPGFLRRLYQAADAASAQTAGQPDAAASAFVGGVVPYIAAGPAAPLLMAGQGMSQAADLAAQKGHAADAQGDAAVFGSGVLQGAIGSIPFGGVVGRVLPRFASPVANFLARYGAHIVGGAMQGTAMALGTNLAESAVDPDRSLWEGAPETAAQMGALSAVMGIAPAWLESQHIAQQQKAREWQNLIRAAQESPIAQRSPERFADLANAAAQGSDVYIPADDVNTFLQAHPDKADTFIATTKIGEQLTKDTVAGADVVIKAGDYLAAQSQDPAVDAAFSRTMRTGLDAPSQADLEHFSGMTPEQLEALAGNLSQHLRTQGDAVLPAAQVYRSIYDEAIAAGEPRVRAATFALIASDRYQARAEAHNEANPDAPITALDAYQNMLGEGKSLHIVGVNRDGTQQGTDMALSAAKPPAVPPTGDEAQPEAAYPTAPTSEWYGNANYAETGGKIVETTPQEFLARARPLAVDDSSRDNIDALKRHIQNGGALDPLSLTPDGKEDGRHRAIAAQELGIKRVPVLVWNDEHGLPGIAPNERELAQQLDEPTPPLSPLDRGGRSISVALADAYRAANGRTRARPDAIVRPDVETLVKIGKAFEDAKHDPNRRDILAAYGAMIRENLDQLEAMADGVRLEAWGGQGEPYASSAHMVHDALINRHLWYYKTEANTFGDDGQLDLSHPLLAPSGIADANGREMLHNDIFRTLHDFYGHTQGGFRFGARGELNAYLEHASMYSEEAIPAVAAETLMQNAWVNYGPHMARPDGTFPKEGDPDYIPVKNRRFAPQKAFVAPRWAINDANRLLERSLAARDALAKSRLLLAEYNAERKSAFGLDATKRIEPIADAGGNVALTHWGKLGGVAVIDPARFGSNYRALSDTERQRLGTAPKRSYYGLSEGQPWGYAREAGVGTHRYTTQIDAASLYDYEGDAEKLGRKAVGDASSASTYEQAIADAGYDGYWVHHPSLGLVAAVFRPLEAQYHGEPVTAPRTFRQDDNDLSGGPNRVLYSALRAAVDSPKMAEKAAPDQWAATLKNTEGVRADEIEWTGLGDYLAWAKENGVKSLTKGQLQEFLDHGGVRVVEIVKGGGDIDGDELDEKINNRADELADEDFKSDYRAPDYRIWSESELRPAAEKLVPEYLSEEWFRHHEEESGKLRGSWYENPEPEPDRPERDPNTPDLFGGGATERGDRHWVVDDDEFDDGFSDPRYPDDYGGGKWRLEDRGYSSKAEAEAAMEDLLREHREAARDEYFGDGTPEWAWSQARKEMMRERETKWHDWYWDDARNYREVLFTLPVLGGEHVERDASGTVVALFPRKTDVKGPRTHFDVQNEIARIRSHDATDSLGRRVHFLGEVQSDWHKAAKDTARTELAAAEDALHFQAQRLPSGPDSGRLGERGPERQAKVADALARMKAALDDPQVAQNRGVIEAAIARYENAKASKGYMAPPNREEIERTHKVLQAAIARSDAAGAAILPIAIERAAAIKAEARAEVDRIAPLLKAADERLDRLTLLERDVRADAEGTDGKGEKTREARRQTLDAQQDWQELLHQQRTAVRNRDQIIGGHEIMTREGSRRFPKEAYDTAAHIMNLYDHKFSDEERTLYNERREATLHQEEAQIAHDAAKNPSGVAAAPFSSTWQQLVMKRVIRMAVDEGHEAVAWIHSGQQNGGKDNDADLAWLYDNELIRNTNALLKKYGVKVEPIDFRSGVGRERVAALQQELAGYGDYKAELERADRAQEAAAAEVREFNGRKRELIKSQPVDAAFSDEFEAEGKRLNDAAIAAQDEYGNRLHVAHLAKGVRESIDAINKPDDEPGLQHGFVINDKLREAAANGFPMFQGGDRDPRGSVTFGKMGALIKLFSQRNASTLIHEFGHVWLEELQFDAMDPAAPQQVRDDMATVRRWLGLAPGDPLSVDAHEKFARGVEGYFRRGASPTPSLDGAFQRYAAWLSRIYKTAADLKADVSPQIGAVFDRFLASQHAIDAAKSTSGYEGLDSIRPLMSAAEWKAYARKIKAADEEARSKLFAKLSAASRREKTSAWKAERAGYKEDALAQVDQHLDIKALHTIVGEKTRISREAVDQMLGPGGADSLPKRVPPIVANDGVHPDLIAERTGHDSGEAMLRDLVGLEAQRREMRSNGDQRSVREARADDMADAAMTAAHGDETLESGDIEAQALDAVNEARRTFQVGAEISALARATGQPDERWRREALKEWARNTVSARTSAELHPSIYLRAERKAANEAQAALLKGDHASALDAKWRQLTNMHLYRAARDAQADMFKIGDLFDKIASSNDKQISASRNMEWVNAARAILQKYGFEGKKNDPLGYMRMVAEYDPETAKMLEPLISQAVEGAQPWSKMSYGEVRDLSAVIDQMWTLARQSKLIMINGRAMEIAEAATRLGADLDALGEPRHTIDPTRQVTDGEKQMTALLGVVSALKKVEEWCVRKGPAFSELIFKPISRAADAYRADRNTILPRLLTQLLPVRDDLKGDRSRIAAPELNYTFGANGRGGLVELLGALRHIGNDSNKEKLLLGRNWATMDEATGEMDTAAWDAFLTRMFQEGRLKKLHLDYLQAEWDMHDQIKPLAQKAHHDLYGRYFAEVTSKPFDTPWGKYRGGYVPAKVDPAVNRDAAMRVEADTILNGTAGTYAFPTASNGFTKARVQYNAQLDLDLRLAVSQMDEVLRFAHMGPAVRSAQRLLMDRGSAERPGFAAQLADHDPAAWQTLLLPWLKRSVSQKTSTPTGGGPAGRWIDSAINGFTRRTGAAIMFGNVANALQHVTSIPTAMVRTGELNMLTHMGRYMANPRDYAARVTASSPMMANRATHQMNELTDAANDLVINPNLYQKGVWWTTAHAHFLRGGLQNIMDPIVWGAAYDKAVQDGNAAPEDFADHVVRSTQGSHNPEDLSGWSTGPTMIKPLRQFSEYWLGQANLIGTEATLAARDRAWGRMAQVYALAIAIPAMASNLIRQTLSGNLTQGWDTDPWGTLMDYTFLAQMEYVAAMVPLAGTATNYLLDSFKSQDAASDLRISPVVSMAQQVLGTPPEVWKRVTGDQTGSNAKLTRDMLTSMTILTGWPFVAVARPAAYLAGVQQGRISPDSPADAARGLVTGQASRASRASP